MKGSACINVLVIVVLCLSTVGTAKQKKAVARAFRWVTKDSALNFLTQEMTQMERFKSDILQPIMVERVSGSKGSKDVQQHITSLLRAFGWHVEEDRFKDSTPYGEKEFTNIIATYDPSKPVKVVLACHFDSKYFASGKFVAATDSAVPCAIILETARQLQCLLDKGPKDKSSAKDLTLQLVFFDGEEAFKDWTATDSIYGARHLANKWQQETDESNKSKLSQIRELILLDLIGTRDTRFVSHFHQTSDLFDQLVKTENHLRSKNYLTGKHPGPIFNTRGGWGGIEDDHIPFLHKGVDILHLISTPFPTVWHKTTDDWDHLDFNLIDDFSRIFRVFISNLLHLQPEDRGCRKKLHAEL